MSDLLLAEERRSQDENYTKPVMRDGGVLDPTTILVSDFKSIKIDEGESSSVPLPGI